ncbi:hypothetical protein [Kutzneria albida]|uniref:Uncharacterized protein n=1 Tax=Kutzneria albida DSM 43870 TaxID=1449976 RepID=W5WBK7_9PSEU|nr:hypothetical protein [Kutzneria albida]AHH98247.1 hypothetical protein KALB_4885 [Kutzneria albida DSM 43870]
MSLSDQIRAKLEDRLFLSPEVDTYINALNEIMDICENYEHGRVVPFRELQEAIAKSLGVEGGEQGE